MNHNAVGWISKILLSVFILCLSSVDATKVYDAFLFFNELDMLQIRLNEMGEGVDYFVLVESKETFRGTPKPLYFEENKQLFSKFLDKIIHIVVEEKFITNDPWKREEFQRNAILRGLKNCAPDDIILVSDVDEIIKLDTINTINKLIQTNYNPCVCQQTLYRYYMNCLESENWPGTVAITYHELCKCTPDQIRMARFRINPRIEKSGWHFTSMGGIDRVKVKMESFSHTEWDNEWKKSMAFIEWHTQTKCRKVEIDSTFPKYLLENYATFYEKGYIKS